jgi:small multidrug resistance pump
MAWFALAVAVFANVVTNISFKLAVKNVSIGNDDHGIISFLTQPWTWIGICAAFVLLASYLLAIRDIGLGVSYAIVTSCALVLITITAAVVFQERLTFLVFLGLGLIVSGIIVLVSVEIAS